MELSSDRRSIRITMDSTLDAHGLSTFIADLAVTRANMEPQVPYEPPQAGDYSTNTSEQDNPYFQARRLRDGRIRLWIRNAGIGWMAFNIPAAQAITLRDYLIVHTDPNASSDLLREEVGGSGSAH